MSKPVLIMAAAVAMLYWLSHTANAAEAVKSPSVVVNFPLVCMDRETLLDTIERGGAYPIWRGIRNGTFLTTLYLTTGGRWTLIQERAMSKTACIFSTGEANELMGIGGI